MLRAAKTTTRELPEGWCTSCLCDLGEVRYGLGQPPEEDPDGLPLIRATNVKRGRISSEGLVRVRRASVPVGRNPFLKVGDIIVVRSGAYTGDVAMIPSEWDGAIAGYDLVFSPTEACDSSFVSYQLLTNQVQDYFRGQRDRSAQPHLNRQQLEATELQIPPLSEQRAIAGVLRTVQAAIGACERVIAATRQLKHSFLTHLFTYGPVPFEQADKVVLRECAAGRSPENWQLVSLESLIAEGPQNGLYRPSSDYGTGTPIIRIDDYPNEGGVIADADKRVRLTSDECDKYALRSGDLLVNRVNSLSHLGKTALIGQLSEPVVFESNMMRFSVRTEKVLPEWLFRFLCISSTRDALRGTAKRAVAQSSINQGDIKSLIVPLPPSRDQKAMVAQLSAVDEKLVAEDSRRDALTALFTSLLDNLMTGRIRLPEFAGGTA